MKVIAINASPRKNKNTAILLDHALNGAASLDAETELIHLYNLNFKGCISCFACKNKNGNSYGTCGYKDDLTPILEKIENADALILGSPIYLGSVTGEMKSFLERLIYPSLSYKKDYRTLFKRKIPTAFLYTMSVTYEKMEELGYLSGLKLNEGYLERTFGSVEHLFSNDTTLFDYALYDTEVFDLEQKKLVKENQFPIDCEQAFDLGKRFVQPSSCQ